ncbi:toxin-antitoxin system YwqK family antitoxin [Seonamhaeicola maritimus]|uniref:Toxin-antitoxin system YwqK family antitoxin n=1 Tax=Seonamhaeicola maritimus TaxID=2591822 RepID=A0A5C7GJL7_9FLAO|nr:hypothetical protein [Seonamhaeicola maritimus]TXG38474.1 hypothetical protein FUA22_00905 [Seonamhaeicola maritimus]
MKIKLYILFLILFFSCKNNPNDSIFKNSDYVFYEEDGKKGYWQKISKDSDFKYKKGILNYYYDNGKRFGEIEILDSLPNRIEKLFDMETDSLIKTVWKKNNEEYKRIYEDGYYNHFYSNKGEIIIEEGLVKNNLEQGLWKRYWNTNGTLKQTINFRDGKKHGKRVNYWENGNTKDISNWNMDKQFGQGIIYYENGKIEEENHVKDGKLHGIVKEYYKSGNIKSKDKYWNGKKCDTSKTFYENGNLKELQLIDFDSLTLNSSGKEFRYFSNGNLKVEVEFVNFKANGNLIIYNEDGVIIERSKKLDNKHKGSFTIYYDSGIKQIEGNANNGYFHGKLNYFDENGKLIKIVKYDNGTALDSIIY